MNDAEDYRAGPLLPDHAQEANHLDHAITVQDGGNYVRVKAYANFAQLSASTSSMDTASSEHDNDFRV